ncbi:MAG: TonB family protein [Phaeodactylibacter sp.]|uniref:energy transducer TonB n=1 Tax=Phaeodactylibacter sp. TaxID=1940289 RepID=UPI0032EAF447
MRICLIFLALSFNAILLTAQDAPVEDTTIYRALERPPRFPACEELDTTLAVIQQCAEQSLLEFMYGNIRYPQEAREQNLEGNVVATFVVEKDGSLSNLSVLKDIGGGAGPEVLRVVEAMNNAEIRWVPAQKEGTPVRFQYTLPIKFKLEEALPYTMVGRDSVYTVYDTPLDFTGGAEELRAYLEDNLKYPAVPEDTCIVGRVELQLLVRPSGEVRILDLVDYNDLGFDFWYEAVDAATSTYGKWDVATYEGRAVSAAFDLSLPFIPEAASCATLVEEYEAANKLAQEGAQLFAEEKQELGLAKLTQAIGMFPQNAEFLLMRGQAYMDMQRYNEACSDLRLARSIALVTWYDAILPIICQQ